MSLSKQEFYKNIFEKMPEGICVLDSSFLIIELNKALESLTGFQKDELIGKSFSALIKLSKNNCSICSDNKESSYIPEQFSHLAEIVNKNGKTIPILIKHQSFDSCYITSITALSEMVCLNQAHLDFVSTVSHELRTPLTSIKGFADTFLNAGDKLDKEQQKKFVFIIKNQTDRLIRLVENLLTVSRLESQKDKYIFKVIDFNKFIEQILYNVSSQNHKIKVEILPNLPPVWADADKLEQIMTNLISNAVKYSKSGTEIIITAGFAANDPESIEIKVKDQGVGIPEEFLPKIFTRFSRIDNPLTREIEGTGLGLYITKSLVENMGGKISVESYNNGSIFIVKLPMATAERHAAQKFAGGH